MATQPLAALHSLLGYALLDAPTAQINVARVGVELVREVRFVGGAWHELPRGMK
jgi:hypothetical protein